MIEFTPFKASEFTQCPIDPSLWITYRTKRNDPELMHNNAHMPIQAGKVNWGIMCNAVVTEYAVVNAPNIRFMKPLFNGKEAADVQDIKDRIKGIRK